MQVAPVSGKVTLKNGQPLARVRVEFLPEEATGERYLRSIGTTDEKGNFTLLCDNGQPGAVIGMHRVVIAPGDRNRGREEENPFQAEIPGQPRPRPTGSTVPQNLAIYTSQATTPERREVVAGDNSFDIKVGN